jgi:cytochrome c2
MPGQVLSVCLRRGLTAALVVTAAGMATAGVAQSVTALSGDPVEGRRLFADRGCVRCHSIWGNGGSLGPDFAAVGAGRSLQQLAGVFWNHTPRMIETVRNRGFAWPEFTEQELANIISYVYYVKLFDDPGDPDQGECSDCHSVGDTRSPTKVALDGYAAHIAPIALAQGMWNAGPAMRARQTAFGTPVPRFVGAEMADIQAFIRERSNLRDRNVQFYQQPDPDRGRILFSSRQCARCHGRDGRGTASGPDLHNVTQLSVSEIAGQLWNHSAQMATAFQAMGIAFPRFAGEEMGDLIAFLYYLRFDDSAGDARLGEQLFVDKGCATCHSRNGQSSIGPDLASSTAVLTPLGLATSMWDHAPAMYDQMQGMEVAWPRFEGDEMRDLSVYLKALAGAGSGDGTGRSPPSSQPRR